LPVGVNGCEKRVFKHSVLGIYNSRHSPASGFLSRLTGSLHEEWKKTCNFFFLSFPLDGGVYEGYVYGWLVEMDYNYVAYCVENSHKWTGHLSRMDTLLYAVFLLEMVYMSCWIAVVLHCGCQLASSVLFRPLSVSISSSE